MDKQENLVSIPDKKVMLVGSLMIPNQATGLILFAHGSGSSRFSPRNNYVAEVLRQRGFGTLLLDLLTFEEDRDVEKRFDINLLAKRLQTATLWLQKQEQTSNLPIGYFGASTGAAAAIESAAYLGEQIKAIVSRGGRPDLAWQYLDALKSPTLLIVGGNDEVVIELNQKAYEKINAIKDIEIVAGATHLFEEPGTLEIVANLAADWFAHYLVKK
ncbi:MAG: dienelactone hydrolase family protein [Enterococcus lemanii]|jgi:putative phosphoribosyl transferase